MENTNVESLKLLRKPFEAHQISQLPKPTKKQTEEVSKDFSKGIRCEICGSWHHPKVVHLSYVGHAALTDRLLDADPLWSWEPVAFDANGLPALDKDGGMWIRLTVSGMTRLGYGDAQGKTGGDAMKERIGDALRNAAMRFGAALDLWHKGTLHLDDDAAPEEPKATPAPRRPMADKTVTDPAILVKAMEATKSLESLQTAFASAWKASGHAPEVKAAYDRLKGLYVPEQPADTVPA